MVDSVIIRGNVWVKIV